MHSVAHSHLVDQEEQRKQKTVLEQPSPDPPLFIQSGTSASPDSAVHIQGGSSLFWKTSLEKALQAQPKCTSSRLPNPVRLIRENNHHTRLRRKWCAQTAAGRFRMSQGSPGVAGHPSETQQDSASGEERETFPPLERMLGSR